MAIIWTHTWHDKIRRYVMKRNGCASWKQMEAMDVMTKMNVLR